MIPLIRRAIAASARLDAFQPLLLLATRWYVASVFFRAGMIKLSDWGSTIALFHDEYKVPVLPPELAAIAGTGGELIFPVLIALGLAGRLGAAGLFAVNAMAVISYPQLFEFECPAAIQSHVMWGGMLLALMAFGPGRWSLDARLGLSGATLPSQADPAGQPRPSP